MRYLTILLILITGCSAQAEEWTGEKVVNYRFYETKVEFRYGDYSLYRDYTMDKEKFLKNNKDSGVRYERKILHGDKLFVERHIRFYNSPMYKVNGVLTRDYKISNGVVKFYDLKNKKTIILSPPVEIERVAPEIYINGKQFQGGDINKFTKENSKYVEYKIPFRRVVVDDYMVIIWY